MGPRIQRLSFIAFCAVGFAAAGVLSAQTPSPTASSIPVPKRDADLDPLVLTLSRSIATMDATGEFNRDWISDSLVTLTLRELNDNSTFAPFCQPESTRLQAIVQKLADTEQFGGIVSSASCNGGGYAADPFKLQFRLHRERDRSPGDLGFIPLHLAVWLPDEPDEDSTPNPISLGPARTEVSRSSVKLPDNWKVTLPEPIHADSPMASFDQICTFEDGKLVLERRFVVKQDHVDVANLESFENWREDAEDGNPAPTVKLLSPYSPAFPAQNLDTEAKQEGFALVRESTAAMQRNDLDAAQKALDAAKAIDPELILLWENYGRLAERRGNRSEALQDYEKELSLHPDILFVMYHVAQMQFALGQREDAIATLQRLIQADPGYILAPVELMGIYLRINRKDLALAVGDQASMTLPPEARKNRTFLMAYASTQRAAGQVEAAAVTYSQLLQGSTDPNYVNDTAYSLAELGRELPLAESAQRTALTQLEADDDSQTLAVAKLSPQQKTSLIIASWDTMGWILFREGKVSAAETYLRAAWRNRQDPTIGKHLGDLLLALKQDSAALETYELALASQPRQNSPQTPPDPVIAELHAAADRLKKAGTISTIKDASTALTQLRSFDLGPAEKHHGESNYALLLSSNGIEVEPNDRESSGDEELIRKAKLPVDFFPKDSTAQILRNAKLTCNTVCTLLLQP